MKHSYKKEDQTVIVKSIELVFIGRYEEAYRLISNAIHSGIDQDHILLHLRLMELNRHVVDGEQRYQDLLQATPFPQKHKNIYELFFSLQKGKTNPAQGVKAFRQLLADQGEKFEYYYGLGVCYEQDDMLDRAIESYKRSITLCPEWPRCFYLLSQIYTRMNNPDLEDTFFRLYESMSPLSLYGNFKTHINLSEKLISEHRYDDGISAIRSLVDWWYQGSRPPFWVEISYLLQMIKVQIKKNIYHNSSLDRDLSTLIENVDLKGNHNPDYAIFLIQDMTDMGLTSEASLLELRYLEAQGYKSDVSERIITMEFNLNNDEKVVTLFEIIQKTFQNPTDNSRELVFLSHLRLSGCDVKTYLEIKKEIMMEGRYSLKDASIKKSLLLLSMFDGDPDIHEIMGIRRDMEGKSEVARYHYDKMVFCLTSSIEQCQNYLHVLIVQGHAKKTREIYDALQKNGKIEKISKFVRAEFHLLQNESAKLVEITYQVLEADPWDYDTLLQYLEMAIQDEKNSSIIELIGSKNSSEFFEMDDHQKGLIYDYLLYTNTFDFFHYCLSKILVLTFKVKDQSYIPFLRISKFFDCKKGIYDLLKLINTNFDHQLVKLGIAELMRENSDYYGAIFWFELAGREGDLNGEILVSITECRLLLENFDEKTEQYLLLLDQKFQSQDPRCSMGLANLYLNRGQISLAKRYLEVVYPPEFHVQISFLRGLMKHKLGKIEEAKDIWRPLIGMSIHSSQIHAPAAQLLRLYHKAA